MHDPFIIHHAVPFLTFKISEGRESMSDEIYRTAYL